MSRLETVAKDLADKISMLDHAARRTAVLHACAMALKGASVRNLQVLQIYVKIENNEATSLEERSMLENIIFGIDKKYFDLMNLDNVTSSIEAEAMSLFIQARAIAAVSFATTKNSGIGNGCNL